VTTSQADDLLAQIRKDPADDVPRQVYADLLEQRGDVDRAQLIQLQVRRAALPAWDAEVTALELQERALLARHGADWRAGLPALRGVTWGSFTRGFVGKVAFDTLDAFAEHRAACLAAAPVRSIAIRWPRSAKQAPLAAIDGVDELTVFGTVMRPDDLKWLAGCPLLAAVRSLNLIDSEIRSGLPHLLKSPHLAQLAALRMPLHLIGNAGIGKLVAAKLPALTELDLSVGTDEEAGSGSGRRRAPAAKLASEGVLAIAGWPGLSRIASLDLSGARLGRDGLTALLTSRHATALRALRIRHIADGDWDMDDSLAAFARGPAGALDELDVGNNDLDPDGASALAHAAALQQLKVLSLERVRSSHFDRLAQAPWLQSLRVLTCGEAALEAIVKRGPKQLHAIRVIADGSVARELVKKLSAAPLPALASLDLSASRITDPSLRVLGKVDTMPKLVSVRLAPRSGATAAFTPEGAADLARSPLGQRLTCLHTGIAELDRLPPPEPIGFADGEYDGPLRYL
jgi:uncharacterized protein (TIGR02996 family)